MMHGTPPPTDGPSSWVSTPMGKTDLPVVARIRAEERAKLEAEFNERVALELAQVIGRVLAPTQHGLPIPWGETTDGDYWLGFNDGQQGAIFALDWRIQELRGIGPVVMAGGSQPFHLVSAPAADVRKVWINGVGQHP